MSSRCDIELLGGFRATVDGRVVATEAWRHRRGAELVKLLALAPGLRLHREQAMDALWPDLPIDAAGANLRKATHFARRALGTPDAIGTEGESIALFPGSEVQVDAGLFEEAARSALRSRDRSTCARAAGLYRGELLPEDRYASWAEDARERLRLRHLEVLKAAGLWERVLESEPADEEAHRALIESAVDRGDRGAAIRQFERLRERLRADLGVGPDRASVELYERALAMGGREPPTVGERAQAVLAWGLVHWNGGDLDEARRSAQEARALAVEGGLGREVGEASALLGLVASARGTWRELFRSEFVESVRRTPHLAPFVFDAHLCLAEFSLYGAEGFEELEPFARDLMSIADEARSIQGRALAELLLGEVDLCAGRLDEAESNLERAAADHRRVGAMSGETVANQRIAEAAVARGQRWRAERLLRRALRPAGESPLAPHLVVRVHGGLVAAAADTPRSVAAVRQGDDALAGAELCPPCSMGFRVAASMAFARAGELEQARRRLDDAERIAGMWRGGPWLAAVWEARGVVRRAEGDEARARALFVEAADGFARSKRPLDETRCRTEAEA